MKVSERIKSLRKNKGISQEELAEHIGVSRQAISKWESEQSTPDMDKIISLSDYFEVSTDYLLKGVQSEDSNVQKIDRTLLLSLAIAFALIAAILSFTANRFRWDEILMISFGATGLGWAVGYIILKGKALVKHKDEFK